MSEIVYNQWVDYFEVDDDGVQIGDDPIGKEYYFNVIITVGEPGIPIASSTGIDPQNSDAVFNEIMYDRFNITIDQLEGEINLPYEYERTPEYQRIRVPHSLLGGFTQFRINYQFIYYPDDAYLLEYQETDEEQEDENTTGFVSDGHIVTTRTIVDRKQYVAPPPEPIPPSIDPDQVREVLADKIYEKFFNSDVIRGQVSDLKSIQTTTSTDGLNYGVGRTSEDDALIFFKKDRNTPENKADFEGDGSSGIQQIVNDLLDNRLEDGAFGLQDISEKLNGFLTILDEEVSPRESSLDLDPPEEQLNPDGSGTGQPLFYRQEIIYKLLYTPTVDVNISVNFAKQYQFFQQQEGNLRQQIQNQYGTGLLDRPDEWANQLNISQLTTAKPGKKLSRDKALTILDTNIFELLPGQNQRQNEINNFFQRFNQLIGPKPSFTDEDDNGIVETIQDLQQQTDVRISSQLGRDNVTAFITRTDGDADEFNVGKTLETMRDTLNEYLGDVDTVVEEINEQRPEYENKSDGFLKIRRLNQSILIKSPTANSSFENWEQTGFTVTMWVRFLNTIGGGSLFTYGNPFLRNSSSFRLETLTKQAGDMMYSYGAGDFVYSRPKRIVRLVVWENVIEDHMLELSNNNEWVFSDYMTNTVGHERRFGYLYDSSVPYAIPESDYENITNDNAFDFSNGFQKQLTWHTQHSAIDIRSGAGSLGYPPREHNFTQYTDIPTDNLDEWFFICATYDPSAKEIRSFRDTDFGTRMIPYDNEGQSPPKLGRQISGVGYGPDEYETISAGNYISNENFWLNHVDANGSVVANSGLGNKCKVEIISRSDLLRARGYRV